MEAFRATISGLRDPEMVVHVPKCLYWLVTHISWHLPTAFLKEMKLKNEKEDEYEIEIKRLENNKKKRPNGSDRHNIQNA